MGEAELGRCLGDAHRFTGVEHTRETGFDIAESASARASVAHDHEGGVLFLPTLTDIRAARFFTHGVERVFAHKLLRGEIARRDWRLDANPVWLWQNGRIRSVRLFRVARARIVNEVEDDRHGFYLRLQVRPRKVMRYAFRIARQINKNTMAPMLR